MEKNLYLKNNYLIIKIIFFLKKKDISLLIHIIQMFKYRFIIYEVLKQ